MWPSWIQIPSLQLGSGQSNGSSRGADIQQGCLVSVCSDSVGILVLRQGLSWRHHVTMSLLGSVLCPWYTITQISHHSRFRWTLMESSQSAWMWSFSLISRTAQASAKLHKAQQLYFDFLCVPLILTHIHSVQQLYEVQAIRSTLFECL